MATQLQLDTMLSINFMPNAIYRPEVCIQSTLPRPEIMDFQLITSSLKPPKASASMTANGYAKSCANTKKIGFLTAIDDFGAGFAGLNLLADFHPDILKLDMDLIRHVDQSKARQAIVRGITRICEELDIRVIAEGVETRDEAAFLADTGIALMQGYLFSKPLFEDSGKFDASFCRA